MTAAVDWNVVNLPAVFRRVVRSYNAAGEEIPDDGRWHRDVSETEFVLAEFLDAKGLLLPSVKAVRSQDLVIRRSQLTPLGQQFIHAHMARWMASLDRRKPGAPINADGLERRWKKFREERAEQ